MATDKARARAHSRRPITDAEVQFLEDLAAELRRLRIEAQMTILLLAEMSQLGERQMRHILNGTRRTRASTLLRVAVVFELVLGINSSDLHAHLVEIAGPALASEPLPKHQSHIDRRRASRTRKKERENERKRQNRLIKSIGSERRDKETRRKRAFRQPTRSGVKRADLSHEKLQEIRRKDRVRKREARENAHPSIHVLPYAPKKVVWIGPKQKRPITKKGRSEQGLR